MSPLTPETDVDKIALSKILAICPRTIDNLIAKGLPHIKYSARLVRFQPGEVRQWIDDNYKLQRRKSIPCGFCQ